jgi:hypothetical protein
VTLEDPDFKENEDSWDFLVFLGLEDRRGRKEKEENLVKEDLKELVLKAHLDPLESLVKLIS